MATLTLTKQSATSLEAPSETDKHKFFIDEADGSVEIEEILS